MPAIVGNVFGVMLNHNDGLAVFPVQPPQSLIDPVRMAGVHLGDGLIQDQDIRAEGHRPRQGQQMGLPAGKLPYIFLFPALQPALGQRLPAPGLVAGQGVVQAGIGSVIQHGGAPG